MHSVRALTRAQKMHLFQLVPMMVQLVKMKKFLFVFKERVNQVSTSESISGKLQPGLEIRYHRMESSSGISCQLHGTEAIHPQLAKPFTQCEMSIYG